MTFNQILDNLASFLTLCIPDANHYVGQADYDPLLRTVITYYLYNQEHNIVGRIAFSESVALTAQSIEDHLWGVNLNCPQFIFEMSGEEYGDRFLIWLRNRYIDYTAIYNLPTE